MKPRTYTDAVFRLPLIEVNFYETWNAAFENTRLGRIKKLIPFKEIANDIRSKMPKKKSNAGRKEMIPLESQVLLLFLRSYFEMSDEKLVELVNGSWQVQMFLGVIIDPEEPIQDGKYISAIRNKIAKYVDINEFQKRFADVWKPYMQNLDTCLMDATCYESYLRFPTDPKLLFECCDWMHTLTKRKCDKDHLGIKMPVNQFSKMVKRYKAYSKMRNKNKKKKSKKKSKNVNKDAIKDNKCTKNNKNNTKQKNKDKNNKKKKKSKNTVTRSIIQCLLRLLDKMLKQWDALYEKYSERMTMTAEEMKRLKAVRDVLVQQTKMANGETIENRIVSIDRPYIRPIVRGKENKKTEFGGKANLIQVDGLSFIQKLSFDAFNEGTQLKESLAFHEFLFGENVSKLGADAIYSTNNNRKECKDIVTNFVPKGRKPAVDPKRKVRVALAKVRSSLMEGCFGNQKEHYDLRRVRARNQASEELQILCAVMMSNAGTLADRIALKENSSKEKKRA